MTNKTDVEVRTEIFYMTKFEDEDYINDRLEEFGFNLDNTNWIYAWSVPEWVPEETRISITKRLEDSDYRDYLVNVRQETPK